MTFVGVLFNTEIMTNKITPEGLTELRALITSWLNKEKDKDIDIINFVRRFQNFIGGILSKCLNIMSD